MTKITEKTEIDALADTDLFYVRDASDPTDPDKKVPFSKMRPAGARITNHLRYAGDINIPTLAAGSEGEGTLTIAGAQAGDHVVFNMVLPANIGVMGCWVSAADTVKVRFRNTHASTSYAGAMVACIALVTRSIA